MPRQTTWRAIMLKHQGARFALDQHAKNPGLISSFVVNFSCEIAQLLETIVAQKVVTCFGRKPRRAGRPDHQRQRWQNQGQDGNRGRRHPSRP